MKSVIRLASVLFVLMLCIVGTAHGAVINDLAGPSDYGATVMPADYSLANATVGDTRQEFVNSCWWNATASAIAHQQPGYLARLYQVQTNGTVNVTYKRNGQDLAYNVTPAINTWWLDPTTSYDDSNGNGTFAIMLKAYAAYRDPSNTMAKLNFGLANEAMTAFGLQNGFLPNSIASIIAAFQAGNIAIVGTGFTVPSGIVPDHDYPVWSVDAVAMTITLRNPWGDGYSPNFPEFITVDQTKLSSIVTVTSYAEFGGDAPPIPTPEPGSLAMLGVGLGLLAGRRK